jgi:hypothetical protein
VALDRLLQGPRCRIPELDYTTAGAGRHQLAVRGECYRTDPAGVALERLLQGVPITWDLWQPTDPTWDLIREILSNDTHFRCEDKSGVVYLDGCLFNH